MYCHVRALPDLVQHVAERMTDDCKDVILDMLGRMLDEAQADPVAFEFARWLKRLEYWVTPEIAESVRDDVRRCTSDLPNAAKYVVAIALYFAVLNHIATGESFDEALQCVVDLFTQPSQNVAQLV